MPRLPVYIVGRCSRTLTRSFTLARNLIRAESTTFHSTHFLRKHYSYPNVSLFNIHSLRENCTKNNNAKNNRSISSEEICKGSTQCTTKNNSFLIDTIINKKEIHEKVIAAPARSPNKDENIQTTVCKTRQKKVPDNVYTAETAQNTFNHQGPAPSTSPPASTDKRDLTCLEWRKVEPFSLSTYASLSKLKLSSFVVLTAMTGYAMAPATLEITKLVFMAIGTFLCALSANSFNQWMESPLDSQMARTRQRPLVRYVLSQPHAFMFATTLGVVGTLTLMTVNLGIALLGFLNIIIYAAVYTPLKRVSITNTWVGSIVGAIPPIIGWGATGDFTSVGIYIIAALLFAWQFPHFCSLSWLYRADYARAGYMMMSVLNPKLNTRVSLRYCLAIFLIIALSCYTGLTSNYFLIDGGIVTLYMALYAFQFWRNPMRETAKSLFLSSLIHLPLIVILMMFHKISPNYTISEQKQNNNKNLIQ